MSNSNSNNNCSNNNSNNNNNMNSMPCPESEEEEEELSGSYNINDNADCSSSSNSSPAVIAAGSSSGKTATSSSSNASDDDADDDDQDEDATDQDTHSNSDSDDATTTQSDQMELAQLSAQHIFRLPRGLCESASIFHEFFSVETWQMLPNPMQAHLQALLPSYATLLAPAQAAAEQDRTLLQLFNGGLQHFGQSPLLRLQRQLEEGSLRPDVRQLRRSIERSQRRERRFQEAERLSRLAKELFLSREQILQQVYNMAPPPGGDTFKAPKARPRKRKTPTLHYRENNRFCLERARKRYCQEFIQLARDLQLQPGDISADELDAEVEEEEKAAQLSVIAEQRQLQKTSTETTSTSRPSNAADKKCIYSTFFKRRAGLEDEQVLRGMQSDKMQPLNERNLKKYLRDYKRRKLQQPQLPDFDTADIRLRDICTRAQFVGNFKPGRKPKALTARLNHNVSEPPALVPIGGNNNSNNKTKSMEPVAELLTDEPQQLYGRAALEPDEEELEPELQEQAEQGMSKTLSPAHPLPKLEPITVRSIINASPRALVKAGAHITGSPTREILTTATTTTATTTTMPRHAHGSYFSLLRDLFVSTPQHRLNYAELHALLLKWRTESCSGGVPDWLRQLPVDWTHLLQSAVNFLSGDFPTLPAEYVPYIEHKTQLNIYQWIGAGRDSDARLQTLCQHWLQRRKEDTTIVQQALTTPQQQQQQQQQLLSPVVDVAPTPPPRCPTSWAVRVATQAEMLEFQRQERLRFDQPHRPFTYRLHGYESVVGPVKGIYTQSLALNKARGHAIMVDDRPPYVTILTLVRDATARLPNGEGTRSEISELLKCSQFVNRQAAENVLQTIVSGALDRMHGGLDPCVRYDARRKIWIYLHRNRSEADFELMHRQNQTMVKQKQQQRKQKPKKDETLEATPELPALVAATAAAPQQQQAQLPAAAATAAASSPATAAVLIKKQLLAQPPLPLQVKCPPVPPLKYHVPPTVAPTQLMTAQKSLLKPTQRSGVVTILDRSPTAPVQLLKTSPKIQQQVPQVQQQSPLSCSPARNTTPILVSTPSGLQTVHVPATSTKKLAIKKPIVINAPNAQTPTVGATATAASFIMPLDQQQQQHASKSSPARQPMPKNIIRLLPAAGASAAIGTAVATKPAVVQLPNPIAAAAAKPTAATVQILGPRMLAQTTVRPLQQQQKIGAVSIISHKPAAATTISGSPLTNASAPTGGTIVKMSPQAFATLQQQQLKQKAQAQQQQQPQQQRILVGNTAISSNKNIVFQALPKASPKILSTMGGQAKTLATANLSPQQQRIVLQSFRQPVTSTAANANAAQTTTTTRIIRTTPVVTSAGSSGTQPTSTQQQGTGGQILTLEGLLQKSNGGKLITTGNNIIQLATSTAGGNVITLSPGAQIQQQQQQTQQQSGVKQLPTTARIVSAGHHGTMVPKIIGKTTVVPGKPVLLHAKTLKLGTNAVVSSTHSPTATTTLTTGAMKTAQNIVIGGQTVKLQGATIPARNATPMQTVIMGNQLLRLATSSSSITTTSNSLPSTSSGIASAPKTLLIGAGAGQTLRLGKNVLLATSSNSSSSSGSNTITTSASSNNATSGNNLVFAVQNNGGQLFFTPNLQGVNLKPLSNMKVIPMSTATTVAGVKLSSVTTATVDAIAGKTISTKMLPTAVLKTAPN
ncbi:nuclear factor related to kappa-B-binding protein [Drosophila grimshawi]|uniref:GH19376 n=1 Tax=Drosophila grimshawi TaxID=7222 RepID=B4JFQ8_DROGR|nr:nuclear factor related to kappa-B-binding protein [Drosophila grimshawi]EDV93539.1 GH19376 [Drosophila grimshawi]